MNIKRKWIRLITPDPLPYYEYVYLSLAGIEPALCPYSIPKAKVLMALWTFAWCWIGMRLAPSTVLLPHQLRSKPTCSATYPSTPSGRNIEQCDHRKPELLSGTWGGLCRSSILGTTLYSL